LHLLRKIADSYFALGTALSQKH